MTSSRMSANTVTAVCTTAGRAYPAGKRSVILASAGSRLWRIVITHACLYNRLSTNAFTLLDSVPGMPALRLHLLSCLPGYEFTGFLRMPYSGNEVLQHLLQIIDTSLNQPLLSADSESREGVSSWTASPQGGCSSRRGPGAPRGCRAPLCGPRGAHISARRCGLWRGGGL